MKNPISTTVTGNKITISNSDFGKDGDINLILQDGYLIISQLPKPNGLEDVVVDDRLIPSVIKVLEDKIKQPGQFEKLTIEEIDSNVQEYEIGGREALEKKIVAVNKKIEVLTQALQSIKGVMPFHDGDFTEGESQAMLKVDNALKL